MADHIPGPTENCPACRQQYAERQRLTAHTTPDLTDLVDLVGLTWMQYDGANEERIAEFLEHTAVRDFRVERIQVAGPGRGITTACQVVTLDGTTRINRGDLIVRYPNEPQRVYVIATPRTIGETH